MSCLPLATSNKYPYFLVLAATLPLSISQDISKYSPPLSAKIALNNLVFDSSIGVPVEFATYWTSLLESCVLLSQVLLAGRKVVFTGLLLSSL